MTVYVDEPFTVKRNRTDWCHMASPCLEELHAMADVIGLERRWFQSGRRPHYDLSPGMRARAIVAGAVPVSSKKLFKECFDVNNEVRK